MERIKLRDNYSHLDGFTSKQIQCIFSLAQGLNYSQTCRTVGVSRDCLWRWRKNPKFSEAIELQKSIFINKMTSEITDLTTDANQLIMQKLDSGDKEAVKTAFLVLSYVLLGKNYDRRQKKVINQVFG